VGPCNILRHQTLEARARPHNGSHGKSHDHNHGKGGNKWNKGADWAWRGGNNDDNDDWDSDDEDICCDSLAMDCVIQNYDSRVHYKGSWVLKEDEPTETFTHNTVVEGSTVSLVFNGKFYQCPLRDPNNN